MSISGSTAMDRLNKEMRKIKADNRRIKQKIIQIKRKRIENGWTGVA